MSCTAVKRRSMSPSEFWISSTESASLDKLREAACYKPDWCPLIYRDDNFRGTQSLSRPRRERGHDQVYRSILLKITLVCLHFPYFLLRSPDSPRFDKYRERIKGRSSTIIILKPNVNPPNQTSPLGNVQLLLPASKISQDNFFVRRKKLVLQILSFCVRRTFSKYENILIACWNFILAANASLAKLNFQILEQRVLRTFRKWEK